MSMKLAGSRAAESRKNPAKFKCTRCSWCYEEPEAGGTVCPQCECKYVTWVNPDEFIEAAERQDKELAAKAEAALLDATNKAKAALRRAKKKKHQQKNASKARKRNRK